MDLSTGEQRPVKPWRQLASTRLLQDRWLSLRADVCELPSGLVVDPYYVLEDGEWVHVLAQDGDGRVLVVRQYRYAVGTVCAELPGGVVEEGESPLAAAKRELKEETGHVASTWTPVGKAFANPARQTNSVHTFRATGLTRQAQQQLDDTEEIAVSLCSVAQIKAMIWRSEFSNALQIASFYLSLDFDASSDGATLDE